MSFIIEEYLPKYEKGIKDLIFELQEFLVRLDARKVTRISDDYKNAYFNFLFKEMALHNGKLFLASDMGKAVGMIVCKIFSDGDEEDILTTNCPTIGFISDLVVTAAYRGKGIAKQLIKKAEEYSEQNCCVFTHLQVFAPNTVAANLYKGLGYDYLFHYMSKELKNK